MRYLIIALLFVSVSAFGQKNRYKAPGTAYTTGTPNFVPVRGTEGEVAIDSLTGKWWQYSYQENAWKHLGYWVTETGTSGAPTYTPNKVTSPLAINNGDSLYHYRAGSWRLVSGGGGGSSEGGGIYGPSDTVTYQHNAVVDSGLTFSSAEDTAYLNILMAPGTFGTGAYFNADSIRLRKYDLAGSNEIRLNTSGITLLTTSPDRVTIQGTDSRYAADYRATYNDRSLIDKEYADDMYLQGVDTFSVSNDTLYLSLSGDSLPAYFVVLPAGSGSDNQTLSIDSTTVGNIERFAVSISNGNTVRFDVQQDQTVVLNEGYGINNSGTYPNFTIAADTTELATVNDINIIQAADDIPANQVAYGTGTGITSSHRVRVYPTGGPYDGEILAISGSSMPGTIGILLDSMTSNDAAIYGRNVSNATNQWKAFKFETYGGNVTDVIGELLSNNANVSSDAIFSLRTSSSGGDPFVSFGVGGPNIWAIGLDNSDSDKMKFTYGSGVNPGSGGVTGMEINTSGNVGIGGGAVTAKALTVTGVLRVTGGTGSPTAILGRDASGDLNNVTIGTGLSLSSGTLSTTGVTLTDGDKGDIDVTSSGTVWTVDTSAITLINMASNSVDSTKIATGAISVTDIGQHGASSGQVLKWNGTQWMPDTDNNTQQEAWATNTLASPDYSPTIQEPIYHNGQVLIKADDPVLTYQSNPSGETSSVDSVSLYIKHSNPNSGRTPAIVVRGYETGIMSPFQWVLDSLIAPGAAPFSLYTNYNVAASASTDLGGDNTVGGMMWNITPQGNLIRNELPGAILQFEQNYKTNSLAPRGDQEFWLGFKAIGNYNTYRPFYFTASRDSNAYSVASIAGNTHYFSLGGTSSTLNKGVWTTPVFKMQNPTTNGAFALEVLANGTGQSRIRMHNPNTPGTLDVLGLSTAGNYINFGGGSGTDVKLNTDVFSFDYPNMGNAIISSRFNVGSANDTINFGWDPTRFGSPSYTSFQSVRFFLPSSGAIFLGNWGNDLSNFSAIGKINSDFYIHSTSVAATGSPSFGIDQTSGNVGIKKRLDQIGSGNALQVNGHIGIENTGTANELRFYEPSGYGTHYTAFIAAAQPTNYTYILPVDTATNGQVLTWNTGGQLSWESAGTGTNIYNTDGNVKDGGTVVDVSGNDPIIFNLDASSTETNTMTRYYVDLTGDDLYTHFTQYVTPQDSLYITSFDSGISIDYEGTPASGVGFTISSNTIMNLTADSILVQTLPTRTTLPFVVGLQNNTLSKIEGTADGQVLVWDETNGGFWEIGTSSGGVSDGDKGDIDVTSGGTVWTVDTSAITSLKILDGTIANADLASGVGGIYKGDGTLPAGTTNALLPASGIFRLEYDGANAGLIVDDINSATTIFSKDGTQFFSADNTQSIIGSGTSKMEYIDGVLRMYDSDATHRISIQTPATGSLTANYTLTLPVDDGADNQFLKTDGSGNTSWATIVMPPGTENIESSAFTALKGIINQVDCSAGTITVTPPASPVIGDRFSLTDATASAGTNNITVDFDTANQNLYGIQQNYIINVDGGYVEFIYMGATTGWIATK